MTKKKIVTIKIDLEAVREHLMIENEQCMDDLSAMTITDSMDTLYDLGPLMWNYLKEEYGIVQEQDKRMEERMANRK